MMRSPHAATDSRTVKLLEDLRALADDPSFETILGRVVFDNLSLFTQTNYDRWMFRRAQSWRTDVDPADDGS